MHFANVLIHSNVASELEEWLLRLRTKFERVQPTGSFAFSGTGHRVGEYQQQQQYDPTFHTYNGQHGRSLSIVEGYISMIVLSIGVFLSGKDCERGMEKVVESFIGDRCQSPNTLYRGKAMKFFVQLAPVQATLVIPAESIYIIPYEIAAYMFDEMLPAIKHVADMDVRSCVRYLEALQASTDVLHYDRNGITGTGSLSTGGGGGDLQQHGIDMAAYELEEPFLSETAHILQALTVCLENLPSSVLNPDMDSDCAVTFFIFKNCVTHMRSVFRTQRPNTLWEPYTLKLVSRFLDVLAMIGRNPQYTERVVVLFSEMQVDCTELQWSSLIGQAQECAGVNGSISSLLTLDVGGTANSIGSGGSFATLRKQQGTTTTPTTNNNNNNNINNNCTGSRHRQFTTEYLLEKQQGYVSSLFILLRQMITHPLIREQMRQYITLGTALEFLFAPRLSQAVLGKTLSLIASLITSKEEASQVWTFLEENHLLRPAGDGTVTRTPKRPNILGRTNNQINDNREVNEDVTVVTTVEARSLLGHCQYECHQATYSITIGFLDLMIAMFKYHVPLVSQIPTYTLVIRFIAEEIFRGVLRRFFSSINERYTVAALAAAALNRALSLRLPFTTNNSMIPFTVVMACSKAPADVLGEALEIIYESSTSPNELLSYQRAAVRQCLALLETAITIKNKQGLDNLFTFDARTASNTELASQLLPLSASSDCLLARKALQLLLLLPHSTLSEAARHWFSRPDALEMVITPFVASLSVKAVSNPIIHVPPALAVLDHDEVQFMLPHAEVETKSLILDLLIKHAADPQTSITSWLCGYPLYGGSTSAELLLGYCLDPVIMGANSREVEETYPHIAVKYVKLLYLLSANPSLSTPSLHRLMKRRGNDEMFYVLQALRPNHCSPLIMSKYAFVLKLLALDIFNIGTKTPEELNGSSSLLTSNSGLVELLFLLLQASTHTSLGTNELTVNEGYDTGIAEDFAQWPLLCLKSLPSFPTNCMAPGGAERYIYRAADDIPQYSIPLIFEALQKESVIDKQKSLSPLELKEQLRVFVKANECLAVYAGGVQFIDGWCNLANIAVTMMMESISSERLVYLAQCMLEAMQMTSSLTIAAQEQIVLKLSETLATVMTQLKRRIMLNGGNSRKFIHSYHRQELGNNVVKLNSGNETEIMDTSLSMSQRKRVNGTGLSQTTTLIPMTKTNISVSSEGTRRGTKRNLGGTLIVSGQEVSGIIGRSLANTESLQLLKSLLITTVQWGPRVPLARQHFYNAIMLFLGIPSVSVDDIALQRHYSALFNVIVQDISATASVSWNGNKPVALCLLSQLLHLSPSLCEMLCVPSSSGDGASPQLMTCIMSAFQTVDESISAFFAHGATEVASLLWTVQIVFDLLMIVSQQHAIQLLHINALSHCMTMKVWKTSARVMLGHINNTSDTSIYGLEDIEIYKEVIKSFLLSTTRWFNVLLSTVNNSESVIMSIAEFIRANQYLFQTVLSSPFVGSHQRHVNSLTLDLMSEIGGLLYRLACSSLVDECRTLVHAFALPDLLVLLTKIEFIDSCIFVPYPTEKTTTAAETTKTTTTTQTIPAVTTGKTTTATPVVVNQTGGSLPSSRQRQLLASATQNILMFVLRAENVVSLLSAWGENPAAAATTTNRSDEEPPHLMDDARNKVLILTVTGQVVSIMENLYNSQILQATHFSPYLIGLHCLVLLLHAFLLTDRASQMKNATSQWSSIVHTLEEAQRVVNLWKDFQSDYTKGLRVKRTGTRWSVMAPSVSNQSIYPAIQSSPHNVSRSTMVYNNNNNNNNNNNKTLDGTIPMADGTLRPLDISTPAGLGQGINSQLDQSYTNVLSTVSLAAAGTVMKHPSAMMDATSMALNNTTTSTTTRRRVPQSSIIIKNADVSIGALVEVSRRNNELVEGDEATLPVNPLWDEVLLMESLLRQVKVAISNALRSAART
ncbi:hypothetical protein LSM04_006736 [Trypanosoma melophagium]|uniref:uncharacterized protein n=1 Tax=Trypanosoma melophagium TaxID=715481 RepID=UPI00351A225F|nr:hypothetical protein LSM04_006736 [Trypanosoma melophagium]